MRLLTGLSILIAIAVGPGSVAFANCPASTEVLELWCTGVVVNSFQGDEPSLLGDYSCGEPSAPLVQPGPEHVYEFVPQSNGEAVFRLFNMDCDFDLYLLDDSCDTDAGCLAGTTQATTPTDGLSVQVMAGHSYFVVVEGFGFNGAGPGACSPGDGYVLELEVAPGTACPEDCADGTDNDLDGDIDCEDSDCLASPPCKSTGVPTSPESMGMLKARYGGR